MRDLIDEYLRSLEIERFTHTTRTIWFLSLLLVAACDNAKKSARDASMKDICGRYTNSTPNSMNGDISFGTGTTLYCKGTFESGAVNRVKGRNTVDDSYFTGTWSVVDEVPQEVLDAVIKFGLKADDDNYSIIRYNSSNGVEGYCLYNYYEPYYSLEPLFLGQISNREWQNVYGAIGIYGGLKEPDEVGDGENLSVDNSADKQVVDIKTTLAKSFSDSNGATIDSEYIPWDGGRYLWTPSNGVFNEAGEKIDIGQDPEYLKVDVNRTKVSFHIGHSKTSLREVTDFEFWDGNVMLNGFPYRYDKENDSFEATITNSDGSFHYYLKRSTWN